MSRGSFVMPEWARGTSLTPKKVQYFMDFPVSVLMLKEARRLQLLQRQENEKLIKAAKMRGVLQR